VPIVFLNPWGGLLVFLLALPLVAFVRLRERDAAVRATLRLPAPSRRSLLAAVAAALVSGALLTLAATQPALVRSSTRQERTDVETLFVLDISRSMLASSAPGSATRLSRAKRIADRLRASVPAVPAGIASVTDRVLPYVMSTSDARVFASTLAGAVAVDQPPPTNVFYDRATDLGALSDIPARQFFTPGVRRRVVVVLTDGESRKVPARRMQSLSTHGLRAVFVHVWQPDDRVFATGRPDKTYNADPASGEFLASLAQEAGGTSAEEGNTGSAIAAVRGAVGTGPTEPVRDHSYVGLMRPLALVALFPLMFALWRRNAWVLRRTYTFASERRNRWLASRQQLQYSAAPPQRLRP
jgi:hypothetical protein